MVLLSPPKLLMVLVIALIVLGPDKLPSMARRVGAAWSDFNRWRAHLESEVRATFPDLPSTTEITRAVRSPLSLLDRLAEEHDAAGVTDTSGSAPGVSSGVPAPVGPRLEVSGGRQPAPGPPPARSAPSPWSRTDAAPGRRALGCGRTAGRCLFDELTPAATAAMSLTLTRARRRAPDTMSVGAHLAELRRRLLVTTVAVTGTCICLVRGVPADPALAPGAVLSRHAAIAACTSPARSTACRCASTSPPTRGCSSPHR